MRWDVLMNWRLFLWQCSNFLSCSFWSVNLVYGNYIEIWKYLVKGDNFLKFWCWVNSCLPYFIDFFFWTSALCFIMTISRLRYIYCNILSLIFMIFKTLYWRYWCHLDKTLIDWIYQCNIVSKAKLMLDAMRILFHSKHVNDSMFIKDLSKQRLSH